MEGEVKTLVVLSLPLLLGNLSPSDGKFVLVVIHVIMASTVWFRVLGRFLNIVTDNTSENMRKLIYNCNPHQSLRPMLGYWHFLWRQCVCMRVCACVCACAVVVGGSVWWCAC